MKKETFKDKYPEFASFLSLRIMLFVSAFLLSRCSVMGGLLPLGLSFTSASPKKGMLFSAVGSALGYFLSGGFAYITALAVICAVKLAFSRFKISLYPSFAGVTALFVSLSLSLFLRLTVGATASEIAKCFAESFISAGGAYFCSVAVNYNLLKLKNLAPEKRIYNICLISFLGMLLMSLGTLGFAGVVASYIISAMLTLCASRFGGEGRGAVTGVLLGFFLFISTGDYVPLLVFTLGGLLSGLLWNKGIIASSLGFIFSSLISPQNMLLTLCECLFAVVLTLLMPKSLANSLSRLFSPETEISHSGFGGKEVSMRLSFAAGALSDMGQTVEQVASRLKQINSPEYKEIFEYAKRTTCEGCGFMKLCWVHKKEDTLLMLSQVSNAPLTVDSLSDKLRERCDKTEMLCSSVNSAYSIFSSKREAEHRLDEVRGVLIDQFGGISDMLSEMSLDFEKGRRSDYKLSSDVSSALSEIGINPLTLSCTLDKFDRLFIEARLPAPHSVINNKQLLLTLSNICDREFDPPLVTSTERETLLMISEKATFSVDSAVYSINFQNNKMCGDSAQHFLDGKGRQIMVLSDGMGTGGRAAVDGAMATGLMSKLIKAGFGFDCSLRMVNSAMLFKSTEESLATLDITSIDLYTGKTQLYKAGACPTVIKRAGKSAKAECHSLPIGIISDTSFDTAEVSLGVGDIIVMMSDGATYDGAEWICEQLSLIKYPVSASTLAERLATLAKRRRTDGHEDDITVMVSILEKAV